MKCYTTHSSCLITPVMMYSCSLHKHFTHFRYASVLNPYSKAVPAVIAKASAIYNPFIYAMIHSKYR